MGREKIAMEFIGKEKKRQKTYQKRKKGLIKKAHELSILCNVPICMIIYPYKEGKPSLQPEVYSFKGEEPIETSQSDNPKRVREIIDRYLAVPKEEKNKRARNSNDMFKSKDKNSYPTWSCSSIISGLSVDQLIELLAQLDQKLEIVTRKIGMIKGLRQSSSSANLIPSSSIMMKEDYPLIYQPTPISSLMMNPRNNNNSHLAHHQMEVFNHHELVSLDPNSVFAHHQMGYSITADQGSSSNSVYDMNMVGPIYYDQGSWVADHDDHVPESSSFGSSSNLPASTYTHV